MIDDSFLVVEEEAVVVQVVVGVQQEEDGGNIAVEEATVLVEGEGALLRLQQAEAPNRTEEICELRYIFRLKSVEDL
jgi:hypothetical protein